MLKLTYDPIKKEIIDTETQNCLYREDGLGEINIEDVMNGEVTFEDGTLFDLSDFCGLELELGIEGKNYILIK